jgi:hypothetical protein
MQKRRRVKHTATFEERLAKEAAQFREAADQETGTARELLLKRARQAEAAARLNDWLKSPGLKSPG